MGDPGAGKSYSRSRRVAIWSSLRPSRSSIDKTLSNILSGYLRGRKWLVSRHQSQPYAKGALILLHELYHVSCISRDIFQTLLTIIE
jgi:hypothetical protein